jgi:hypothetical protein
MHQKQPPAKVARARLGFGAGHAVAPATADATTADITAHLIDTLMIPPPPAARRRPPQL